MSTKRGIFNTLVGVIMTIIISIFQLTFIYVLSSNTQYQSQFVGLLRVIVSFLSYLSLAEGGLGLITIFSLYRPLQNGDFETVNDIINTTRKNYQHNARIYTVVIVFLAFAAGFLQTFAKRYIGLNIDIPFWQIALIIMALASKELIYFYFSGAYQNLIQADQKGYLNRLVYIFSEIIMFIILISMFVTGIPLYIPFVSYFICGLLKTLFTLIIIKIEYPWLQHKKWIQQKRLLKQSWWVALSRFPELLVSNIDIILITVFLSLNVTTIYTFYLIIATTIRQIALILISSFREVFGYWIAKSGRIRWSTYTKFEMYSYMITAFCFILQFIVSQYLVSSIYGEQLLHGPDNTITGTFIQLFLTTPTFILFLSLKNAVEIATEPGKVIVNATVKHKETIWGSYIHAIIIIVLGIIFGWSLSVANNGKYREWALYMIMFSVFLGWLYRLISIWVYVWKHLTYNSDLKYIIQNTLVLILPILAVILFNYLYLYPLDFSIAADNTLPNTVPAARTLTVLGYTLLYGSLTVFGLSMIINFKQFWSIFNLKSFFNRLFKRKKAQNLYNQEYKDILKDNNLTKNTYNNTIDWTTSFQGNKNIDELLEQELIKKQQTLETNKKQEEEKPVGIYIIRG